MRAPPSPGGSNSASMRLTEYVQVDMLGVRYESVDFGAGTSLGSPDWARPHTLIP